MEARSLPVAEDGLLPREVVCRKARWMDVFLFIFTNYIVHSASVPSSPGRPWYVAAPWIIVCAMLPFAGYQKSVNKISRAPSKSGIHDDVHRAIRQNALFFVARNQHWKPWDVEESIYFEEPITGEVYVACSLGP